MRAVVIGTSGSGKSTFAQRLSAARGLPFVEVDALNWGPGWNNRNLTDHADFLRRIEDATAGEGWVVAGNYSKAMASIRPRATHLVWLDYSRAVIMPRVIRRSVLRAIGGKELWPGSGNREDFRRWLDREHPIRWAWDTHALNRERFAEVFADPALAHLEKHRPRTPREAEALLAKLISSPAERERVG